MPRTQHGTAANNPQEKRENSSQSARICKSSFQARERPRRSLGEVAQASPARETYRTRRWWMSHAGEFRSPPPSRRGPQTGQTGRPGMHCTVQLSFLTPGRGQRADSPASLWCGEPHRAPPALTAVTRADTLTEHTTCCCCCSCCYDAPGGIPLSVRKYLAVVPHPSVAVDARHAECRCPEAAAWLTPGAFCGRRMTSQQLAGEGCRRTRPLVEASRHRGNRPHDLSLSGVRTC